MKLKSPSYLSNHLLIIGGMLLFSLMLIFTLVFTANKLTSTTLEKATQVIHTQYQKLNNLMNLHIAGQKRTVDLELLFLLDDPFEQDKVMMEFHRDGFLYGQYRDQLAALIDQSKVEKNWLQRLDQEALRAGSMQNDVAQMALDGRLEEGREILVSQSLPDLQAFSREVNEFSGYQLTETEKLMQENRQSIDQLMLKVIGLATVLISLTVLFSYYLLRKFKKIHRQLTLSNEQLEKEVALRTEDLLQKNKLLEALSVTDPLTQLANRLKIEQQLEGLHQTLQQQKCTFCVMLLDIDYFKKINDCYGHAVGDEVLKTFAARLRHYFKSHAHIGRWGGEEFIVILEGCQQQSAFVDSEGFRQAVEQFDFPEIGRLTVSIGVAAARAEESVSELLYRADMALYAAKHAGRNRVKLSE